MRISDMPTSVFLTGEEFVPIFDPNQADASQQNRKVGLENFRGLQGSRGFRGLSAYEVWLNLGNIGTDFDFIQSLQGTNGTGGTNGTNGLSAYGSWINVGNNGSEQDFVNSLKGLSAYQVWRANGNIGSTADFIESLRGPRGFSPYEIWLQQGNSGTESDYIRSLTGLSAYEIWTNAGNVGTIQDYLDSLRGQDGTQGAQGIQGNQGIQGPQGVRGNIILAAGGNPSNNLGAQGDYYINTATSDFYGPKSSSGWNAPILNLRGPQGPQGIQGIQGPAGANGATGPQGVKGDTGNTGAPGPQGPQGIQGVQGPAGTQGVKGDTGNTGAPGPQGPQGIPGTSGTNVPTATDNTFGVVRLATINEINSNAAGALAVTAGRLFAYLNDIAPALATAWVNFDGATSPPSIKTAYNINNVVRVATGIYDLYFVRPMDNVGYAWSGSAGGSGPGQNNFITGGGDGGATGVKTQTYLRIWCRESYATNLIENTSDIGVIVFGGRSFSGAGYVGGPTSQPNPPTPASPGPSPNPSPGGGGCVVMESYLGPSLFARDVRQGDILFGMDEDTRRFMPMAVSKVRTPEMQPCIRVVTEAGPSLIFSLSTPLTMEDSVVMADELEVGMRLPVQIGEDTEPFWNEVISIEHVGVRQVQLISVGGHCYAAGENKGMYIYTHNIGQVKD